MNDATNTPAPAAVDPTVVTTQQYRVPAENFVELSEKIAKLNRKAQKLGVSSITLTKIADLDVPFLRTERDLDWAINGESSARYTYKELNTPELMADAQAKAAVKPFGAFNRYSIIFRKYHTVELTGAVPRLAGWDFVATLQHLEVDGEIANMLRIIPGFEGVLPLKFRNCGPENCDHCKKTIRSRKETFVVRNVETGEWLQVGRNCTQDFLGGKDPHAVAKMLEYLQTAASLCGNADGEESYGGGRIEETAELTNFLTWVAACVRIDGWISRGKARGYDGQVVATADQAFTYINPPDFRGQNAGERRAKFEAAKAAHQPTQEDIELAEKAVAYAEEDLEKKMEGNDYLYNLWVACNQTILNHKLIGIAASLISHFIKEVERRTMKELELRTTKNSVHVGTVGERRFFEVKVLSVKMIGLDSQFGPKALTKMADTQGNLIVWFDSTPEPLKTGQDYILKATVKKHDEYQGQKQTIINRAEPVSKEVMEAELVKAAKKAERAAKKAAKAALDPKPEN